MAQAQGLVDIHNILFMRKNGDTWQRHAKPHKLLMFPSRHEIQLIREQQEEEEEGKTVIVVLSSAVGGVLHASLHARSIMRLTIQGQSPMALSFEKSPPGSRWACSNFLSCQGVKVHGMEEAFKGHQLRYQGALHQEIPPLLGEETFAYVQRLLFDADFARFVTTLQSSLLGSEGTKFGIFEHEKSPSTSSSSSSSRDDKLQGSSLSKNKRARS